MILTQSFFPQRPPALVFFFAKPNTLVCILYRYRCQFHACPYVFSTDILYAVCFPIGPVFYFRKPTCVKGSTPPKKTGFLKRGDNQIKEILKSSLSSVFFIDEDQRVSVDDYGEIYVIEELAKKFGISVHKQKLESQFRCNGSDGYLAWVDHILQIKETANYDLSSLDYEFDFQVFDNPKKLQEAIYEKNEINNKARLVAGYCWKWDSNGRRSIHNRYFCRRKTPRPS